MYLHFPVGRGYIQPSLRPQVLSLLLGPYDGVFRRSLLLYFANEKTEAGRGASTAQQRL